MATKSIKQRKEDEELKRNIIRILESECMLAWDISTILGVSIQKTNGLLCALEDDGLVGHTLTRVQGNLRKVYRLIE